MTSTLDSRDDGDLTKHNAAGPSTNGASGYHPPQSRTTGPGRSGGMVNVEPPKMEDLQPDYAQTLHADDAAAQGWYGSMINTLGSCIGNCGAIPCCIICPNPYKPVSQGNVGLVTKFGRFYRTANPGLVKINPLSERLIQVDVKIQIVEVPKQVCMTKDNVTLHLTSVIYYHITSPHKAAFGISNVRQALVERTQTTLRHVVGARVLQDVIERREEVAQSIGEIIEDVASGWGVQVESMLIKDIIFSSELQDSLSMAAQAKRIGESKVIAARAEVESAKLMRQAADILSSAPAMQIRYLEAMQAMAKSANSKVIFLPGASQVGSQMASAFAEGSDQGGATAAQKYDNDFGGTGSGFQQAMNAQVIENI
ncbi:putative band 7 family protein [Lachnellula subtilissima]|uniref:Putative band 7 family protein n=1 Tax=Lachnellula subtilissima TaxID=602034 RepID=A0A8H8RFJ5_9HELO|nr:putative band 7 family protein [Lachnellula subtilissima]